MCIYIYIIIFFFVQAEKLEHIMREEAELGLEPTVTQVILSAVSKLEDLQMLHNAIG